MQGPTVGDTIDRRFVLKRAIALGGMGAVFEAEQLITGRRVALKVPRGSVAHLEKARERLLREARAITAARHPGIVELLDAGVCSRFGPYLVLDLLHGCPLDVVLDGRGQLPVQDVVKVGRQICEALAFAHERGVIHRDLKPNNVFLAVQKSGVQIKLFDFGIADVSGAAPGLAKLTEADDVLGTPEYMAPEQLLAKPNVDHRCDIYAVGVSLFECLTGAVPFTGNYHQIFMTMVQSDGPPSIRDYRPDVSPELDAVIARALARDPDRRYPDASSFLKALEEVSEPGDLRTTLSDLIKDIESPQPKAAGDGAAAVGEDEEAPPDSVPLPLERRPITAPIPLLRRTHFRAPYATTAHIERADGSSFDVRTRDIGEGGMMLLTTEPLVENQVVYIRFVLPTTDEWVNAGAKVRYADPDGGIVGLQFLELASEHRDVIADFVEDQLRQVVDGQ